MGCPLYRVGHARRTYLPHMVKHSARYRARLAAVVELEICRNHTEEICARHGIAPEQLYISPFDTDREKRASFDREDGATRPASESDAGPARTADGLNARSLLCVE